MDGETDYQDAKSGEVGMTVREAIITLNANVIFAYERSGFDSTTVKMIEDALDTIEDALKAQEPRVIAWHEVIGATLECRPVYIEVKDSEDKEPGDDRWAMMTQYKYSITNGMIRAMSSFVTSEVLFADRYGKTWRCWTSRPTDEQREATPWN